MLPLFFQVVLLDSAAKAGARLAIPSLATPLGGIIAGFVMSRYGRLIWLVRTGALLMAFGNALVTSLGFSDVFWKYYVFIFSASLGQGIMYPVTLFTNLATFEHSDHAVSASTVYLVRSVGSVWGVAISSAIVQTTLKWRLPEAMGNVDNKAEVSLLACRTADCANEARSSSMGSDILSLRFDTCRSRFSYRCGMSITMAYAPPLRYRLVSWYWGSSLRCWRGLVVCVARSEWSLQLLAENVACYQYSLQSGMKHGQQNLAIREHSPPRYLCLRSASGICFTYKHH